jgi:hypothetical protein
MSTSLTPDTPVLAPELAVSRWFNTDRPLTLDSLRGEVVLLEAFQMLCPGCVAHGLPLAQRVQAVFGRDVRVLGLHTVFEHHAAMSPVSLEAFLHEYGITFPVGVDEATPGDPVPVTMRRLALRGTPSTLLVDRAGRLRVHAFGQVDEMALGATIARLVDEDPPASDVAACNADGCALPA